MGSSQSTPSEISQDSVSNVDFDSPNQLPVMPIITDNVSQNLKHGYIDEENPQVSEDESHVGEEESHVSEDESHVSEDESQVSEDDSHVSEDESHVGEEDLHAGEEDLHAGEEDLHAGEEDSHVGEEESYASEEDSQVSDDGIYNHQIDQSDGDFDENDDSVDFETLNANQKYMDILGGTWQQYGEQNSWYDHNKDDPLYDEYAPSVEESETDLDRDLISRDIEEMAIAHGLFIADEDMSSDEEYDEPSVQEYNKAMRQTRERLNVPTVPFVMSDGPNADHASKQGRPSVSVRQCRFGSLCRDKTKMQHKIQFSHHPVGTRCSFGDRCTWRDSIHREAYVH